MQQTIIVLDFGGQYNQLIVRRVREAGVYCELLACDTPIEKLKRDGLVGVILTGGPQSVFSKDAKSCDPAILELGVPVLGICYGHQWLAHTLGGTVADIGAPEYGRTQLEHCGGALFDAVPASSTVWMNHHDSVTRAPEGFKVTANTSACPVAAMECSDQKFYGVQFHPEVVHTEYGPAIIANFVHNVCGCGGDWSMDSIIEPSIAEIRRKVGSGNALCALSGGVDSSVAAVLVNRAIGSRLTCVFVDHGLLRQDEAKQVLETYRELGLNIVPVNASKRFLEKLRGVTDPEKKRKIIGTEFIRVFEEEAKKLKNIEYLVQGTIYPDVIESGSGNAAVIKSHHNVGGLPDTMTFKGLLEPLRMLFKDEVRALGRALGIKDELVERQPFPGPGLAIRILGEVTEEKLEIVRHSDAILREEIKNAGLQRDIWQYFTVFTPLRTVGVMGDERTYDHVLAVRAVTSTDAMTVEPAPIPHPLLARISSRIINEVKGVNRVVYDITSKPPATIEWE